ncbi:hypothetical protein [Escherichia phage PhiV-1]|uniref:Uncharacterized protein n=3 Tax=Berlinvirus TaxID=2732677 RepID=A0A7G3WWN9_9CAUD|nr:hypothetical protein LXB_018 [Escherichia phage 285P]YP_008766733.1 hypothetical protein V419_gp19 [Erwinia phage FE44]ACV32493.1 unknown [Escherichia phage 285P]AGY36916.1 hypothetical protein FIVT_0015B [Erwinia phage FE44]QLF85767.1 hypothetical protein [Escherichia phage PhiV-1]
MRKLFGEALPVTLLVIIIIVCGALRPFL